MVLYCLKSFAENTNHRQAENCNKQSRDYDQGPESPITAGPGTPPIAKPEGLGHAVAGMALFSTIIVVPCQLIAWMTLLMLALDSFRHNDPENAIGFLLLSLLMILSLVSSLINIYIDRAL